MTENKLTIVRLDSGEELLANVQSEDNSYILTDIAIIIPQENTIGLMHFAPYTKVVEGEALRIPDNKVTFMVNPVDGLADKHGRMFEKKSALDLPKEGLILPK